MLFEVTHGALGHICLHLQDFDVLLKRISRVHWLKPGIDANVLLSWNSVHAFIISSFLLLLGPNFGVIFKAVRWVVGLLYISKDNSVMETHN